MRWKSHKTDLRNGKHHNRHLQWSWDKYGEEAFTFYVVELCDEESLSEREIFYIDKFDTFNSGYNMTGGGDGSRGTHHTEEWKAWMRMLNTGKELSEETRRKLSEAHKGKHYTVTPARIEANKKLSESLKGRVRSEEHCKHLSESLKGHTPWNKGKKMPDDYVHPWLGKHLPDEMKKKIGDANRGRKRTAEERQKISKRVICIETNVIYPSITEAANDYGVTIYAISRALRGKAETSCGKHWKYCEEE